MSCPASNADISLPVRVAIVGTYQSVVDAEDRPIAYVAIGLRDKCRAELLASLINTQNSNVEAPK